MKKVRFYYDTKSLNYERVHVRFKDKFLRFLSFVFTGIIFALGIVYIAYTYFDSPKEKRQKREIEQLTLQYEILNNRLNQFSEVLGSLQQRDDNIYRVIFEAEPISSSIRNAGFGGVDRYKDLEGYDNSDLVKETTMKLDMLSKKLYIQSKSLDEVVKMAKNKEHMLASIPAIQPVSNKDLTRMASGFGYRVHPIYKVQHMHTGMDFTSPTGTEIYATGDGTVTIADAQSRGYGNHVVINHGYGYQTLYGHMSKIGVKPGQKVKRGEVIGYVGSTGTSTAPHLHYEVIKGGNKINPINYYYNDLTPAEYDAMLELASQANQSFD
jgi:murein DD-endopeptidase MepM/ murein hydrolase activator NlpD